MDTTMGTRGEDRAGRPTSWRALAGWLDRPLASWHLILAVFALMLGFGLMMVLSSSATRAFRRSDSAFSVFTSQVLFAAIGLVAFIVIVRLPLRFIRSISTTALIVSLGLLVAVLIPGIGQEWNGARSWITIGSGLQFQPSEVAKLALLLWSAHVLASVQSPYRRLKSLLVPVGPVFLLIVGLVMLQPDLGTTVTLAIVLFAVLFFAGAQLWIFIAAAGAAVGGVWLLAMSAGYRVARITAWLYPEHASPASTYQASQGFYALGSGGLFGTGLGTSKMKWGRLPNADSDYIFAIIGEELGLLGTLTVLLLFALLTYTGLRIARRNVDPFVKIAAAGGTIWLVGQAAINMGYVTGLLPVTGLPLPMFSAGGTSLVITMMVFGLLANFARREPAAMAALHRPSQRGVAGYFGIGSARRVDRTPSRSAQRRGEKVRAQRVRARQVEVVHHQQVRRPGAARHTGPRAQRPKSHPVRRALGFPVPGERPGSGTRQRQSRAGAPSRARSTQVRP